MSKLDTKVLSSSKIPVPMLLEREANVNLHVDFGPRSPLEKEYDEDKVKFSNEHPTEAFRIKMKRKSMEEAALEEAYEEKAGE
jgi:hypothetical protein